MLLGERLEGFSREPALLAKFRGLVSARLVRRWSRETTKRRNTIRILRQRERARKGSTKLKVTPCSKGPRGGGLLRETTEHRGQGTTSGWGGGGVRGQATLGVLLRHCTAIAYPHLTQTREKIRGECEASL